MAGHRLVFTVAGATGAPVAVAELKKQLVLWTDRPPDARVARRVYDLYMSRYGSSVDAYRSTAPGSEPEEWDAAARAYFETVELPALCTGLDWGYAFGSLAPTGARMMMFHGARPASQPGCASLYRFDFEWDFPALELARFAADIVDLVGCVWGSAGYGLYMDESVDPAAADNRVFGWAMRYWGAEARDFDVLVEHALRGIACVNWLTIVGPQLLARDAAACRLAQDVAHASSDVAGHRLLLAEPQPRLIDRNRRESLGGYAAVAQALLPLQIAGPIEYGGDLWDDDNTVKYLRRFTHPGDL